MKTITLFSLRHKWTVICVWLFLAGIGASMATFTISRLNYTYSTPGQAGYEANLHLTQRFGIDGTFEPTIAVLHLPAHLSMNTPAGQAAAQHTFEAASRPGVVAVEDYANTHNPKLVSADGRTTWAILNLANPDTGPGVGAGDRLGPILQAAAPAGASVTVTGFAQLLAGATGGFADPSVFLETLIGGILALLLLLVVYGSAIAIVPLLIAVPSILVTFLCMLGLTYITDISYFLQYLVALVGLGVAVDYSLLVVVRWREACERGLSNTAEGNTSEGKAIVNNLRERPSNVPGGAEVGGSTAGDMAFSHAVYGNFPLVLLLVTLLSFLVLLRAFRSVVLAIKAVLLNVLSLGTAFGFMVGHSRR